MPINTVLTVLVVAVISYLLGSLNFALIISRWFKKDDIRNYGSGSAGMTNILRTYGKSAAAFTVIGDFLKAIIAIFFARWLFAHFSITGMDAGYIAGIFVLLGHLFPVYFGFRGGKGVVTTLAIILTVNPVVFLIICVIFIPLVCITRIVSLGSVLGAVAFPFLTLLVRYLQGQPMLLDTLFAAGFAVVVLVMHRENIKRLLSGTENRFEKKKK